MLVLKLKISGKKPIIYNGVDTASIPTGTILKVISGHESAVDDIVLRTDEDERPFVSIFSKNNFDIGFIWGPGLGKYKFQVLDYQFIEVDLEALK